MVRNNVGLFRQFRGIGAALVHANDLNVLPASYLLARYWRAALVYDSHELWTELDAAWSPLLRRLFALLEGALIGRAGAVVTVNSSIASELAQRYRGVQPVVVMNCAELPTSSEASNGAVAAACMSDHRVPVIYQGMLHRHSGMLGVIDAAIQVPEISLSIRGPGDLLGEVQEYLATRHLERQVRLLDPVPMRDLIPALHGYAVGLVPYLPVGLNYRLSSPNKLFEYMAAGLAVVCSDLPVLREVVQEAQCGLLYEPGDVQSLAQAFQTLAQDPELVQRFRANALAAVRRRYNAAHEEGRLMDIYARLLTQRRPVAPEVTAHATPIVMHG